MSREDLLTPEGARTAALLNELLVGMRGRGTAPSSWLGTVPGEPREPAALENGVDQRLDYAALPGAVDDMRLPWFLYWEIHWCLSHAGRALKPGARVLDAGGAASLFYCCLASLGHQVHAVDLNEKLCDYGNAVSETMGWDAACHAQSLAELDAPDHCFDHAFSVCVFEHLDADVKRAALEEIARTLKPGGFLSLTFDYKNPAPGVFGVGKDPRPRNRLSTPEDLERNFLGSPYFELVGNGEFADNGEHYLRHPLYDNAPYTFGAMLLRRV